MLEGVTEFRLQMRPSQPKVKLTDARLGFLNGQFFMSFDSVGLEPNEKAEIFDFRASEVYAAGRELLWEEVKKAERKYCETAPSRVAQAKISAIGIDSPHPPPGGMIPLFGKLRLTGSPSLPHTSMRDHMKRSMLQVALFALFLLFGHAVSRADDPPPPVGEEVAPPEVKITKTAPGVMQGSIVVDYSFKNAPNAKQVRFVVINPPNPVLRTAPFPVGPGKGSEFIMTLWPNAAVTVEVELLDANAKLIVKSAPPTPGMTK